MKYLLLFLLFSISNLTAQTIRINEVVSSNSQHMDEDGDTPDWLELHNYGSQSVSINNWGLTDDEDDLTQWTLPSITLAPDQYLLIWASDKDRSSAANALHTNFKISSSSETLILTNTSGTVVDQITAENLTPDTSLGRSKNSGNLVVYLETTPGNENSNNEYQGTIQSEVVFSQEGGLVNGPISLTLSGNASGEEIRFTIGGSMPTETATLYSGPIQINASSSIKAQIFAEDYIPSSVYTKSYILNANHEIDVILLTADAADFFDENTGIYVTGPNDPGPFPYRGANFWKDWERPIHFAFYEHGENTSVEFNAGVKIFGGWSRANRQKSLSLFARGKYGDSKFDHSFFDELNYDEFEALVLRNSGQDWLKTQMKDIALSSLMRGSGLDFQEHTPVATYLNGDYWGMYNLREKVNEHMLASKHNVDADDITLLDDDAVEDESNPEYNQLINYLSTTDLTIDSNFEYVTQVVDIEEYVLYHATEIFFNNTDWPGNNIKFWKHPEGKWRWVMFDTDNSFSTNWSGNALRRALADNGPVHPNPPESTLPFRRLVTNIGFRNKFINRYADELNTRFLPNKVISHIDQTYSTIQPEINAHFDRWNSDPARAILYLNEMKTFANNRPEIAKNNIRSNFNLPGYHPITIRNLEISEGFVEVNSNISIQEASWTGDYFQTVPIQLKAIPLAGFEFSHWSGDIASTDETISITLVGNLEVIPNFSPTDVNDPIVINEINYKSSDDFDADDWVELYNPNESSIDLSDWQLKDDNDSNSFTFPVGTSIDAGGYIVLVKTALDFSSVYPDITNFIGDIDFGFGTSDAVRLFDANGSLEDEVVYQSEAPWSDCADETGNTLQLISPDLDNALPDSWSCINTNGSPNAPNDSEATADAGSDRTITLPTDSVVLAGAGNDPDGGAIVTYAWTQIGSSPSIATLTGEDTTELTASDLLEGTYIFRLTITDDEGETGFDDVSVTVSPDSIDTIWLEAECAVIGDDWSTIVNTSSSNGQHMLSPVGDNIAGPPTDASQMLTFDFQADAGAYAVHALVQASTGADDSFWVRSNGGTWIRWNKVINSPTFVWDQVHNSDNGALPVTFNLVQGTNSIDIALREDGASIDKIYITSTSSLPSGLGETASNCVVVSQPPTANAGSDQNIMLPTDSVILAGLGNDPDGGAIVTYSWTQIGSSPSIATLVGEDTTVLTASDLVEGTYVFRLTVTDDEGETGFDEVSVTVSGIVLLPPTADAGSNQSITWPTNNIVLNGSGNDPDGGAIVSYAWTQIGSSPSIATLAGEDTTELTASDMVVGSYVFRLTVADDEGETGFDEVTVNVTEESSNTEIWLEAECAIVGADWSAIANGSSSNGQYMLSPAGNNLDGPPTSTNQMLTFNFQADAGVYSVHALVQASTGADDSFWVRSNGGTWIRWNKVTNSPTFVWDQVHNSDNGSQPVNFNLVQGTNSIDIALREDGASIDKIYITSTSSLPSGLGGAANNCVVVSESPTANAGANQNLMLPADSAVFNGSGNDPDGGAIVSYAWTQIGINPSIATLAGEDTTVLTANNLIEGTYVFRLIVTDDEGETGFDEVSVTVSGIVLLPPTADAGSNQSITLPTNNVVLTGSGNDPDGGTIVSYAWTQIGSSPMATLAGEDTTELTASDLAEGTYVFRLTVTDDEGETGFDQVNITVFPDSINTIWLEAECAIIGDDWTVMNDGGSSNGQHLATPSGNNLFALPTNSDEFVTFNFQADAGTYSVHALVQASTSADDSFWVRSNGGSWIRWNKITNSPTFVWDQVHDSDNGSQSVVFNLVQGTNSIDIALREDGALLDKIYVTSTSNLPSGLGGTDFNCSVGNGGSLAARSINNANLSPNPATTSIALSFDNPAELRTIQVFDVMGRLIKTYNNVETSADGVYILDVRELAEGAYFMKSLDTTGVMYQEKMVIIR